MSTDPKLFAVLVMLLLPTVLFAKPITPATLFKTLKPGEPWDKSILSATKTVLFSQTASGGTDATVIEQAQLGFFTTVNCHDVYEYDKYRPSIRFF